MSLEDAAGHSAEIEYDGPRSNLLVDQWHQWRIILSQFAAQGVDLTAIKKLVLGLGDSSLSQGTGASGYMFFDDIRLYPSVCIAELAPAADLNDDCVVNLEDFGVISDEWLAKSYTLDGEDPGTSALLVHYKFDETADSNAMDSSGNGHTASFSFGGGLTVPVWEPAGGYHDGCLSLDDDTAVHAPNDVFTGAEDDLTICVWVAGGIGTVGRDNTVMDIGIAGTRFLRIDIPNDSGDVFLQVGDANNTVAWDEARAAEWLDLWNHYAFVKDSSGTASAADDVLRIYANGRLVVEQTGVGAVLPSTLSNTTFKIGAQLTHNNDFIGKVDDLRIYGRVLSQAQIVGAASGGGDLYVPVRGLANLHADEEINYKDLAAMLDDWLVEKTWP